MAEKPSYEELEKRVLELERAELERQEAEEALKKRILALSTPSEEAADITFEDLFNLEDIQRLQDEFADATGVAAIITHKDGTPITRPSNFCRLCNDIIRKTEKGRANCYKSDAVIGRFSPHGPTIQPCMSGGLWDAGAAICVGGRHIANWLIGQVRDDTQSEDKIRAYAREIGADEAAAVEAFREVPAMSRERFEQIARMLFTFANQLSATAYYNLQQARFIIEHKRVEEALKESEAYLRTLIRTIPDLVWMKDPEGTYLFCNSSFERFFGAKEKDIVGKTDYDFVDGKLADLFRRYDKLAMDKGGPKTNEEEVVYADDDHRKTLETIKTPIYRNDGRLAGVLGIGRDITERKNAEQERLANLHFFKSLDRINRAIHGADDLEQMTREVLNAVLPIFDCDRAYLLYPCDPEAGSWRVPVEATKPEFPGALALGLEIPMDEDFARSLQILLDTGGPVTFGPDGEYPLNKDVSERFEVKSLMSIAVFPRVGKPWQFGIQQCSHARTWTDQEKILFQEISRRLADGLTAMLTHRDLQESEEFLNNIIENIPNMIFVKDAEELRFIRLNKAGEELLGYSREKLVGKNDYDFFPKEEADFFTSKDREVLNRKILLDIPEEEILTGSRDKCILRTKKLPIMDEAGKPKYLLGISEDITERKKLEEQLHQAQKMESIGRLAGGVAHDFNNILGVIIGNVEMALDEVSPGHAIFNDLQEIRKAAQRSANLTRQLLAFARKQTIAPEVIDLNQTVAGMLKMLQSLIGEDIDLVWHPGTDVWPVMMDSSQIDQILANLCVNARDAIDGVGKVSIETDNATFDKAYCADHAGFFPGDYVMVAVSDDGSGMDAETLDKIFEPFFTTKGVGRGTGLGLSTVYGIVKQNDGFINVYSEPGQGTTFRIYLPRHGTEMDLQQDQGPQTPLKRGHETILLVEDEMSMLQITRLILERLGYHVLAASRPSEAIRLAKESGKEIELLFSDIIMPEMNGRELADQILAFMPAVRCLFMSGYTGGGTAHHGALGEGNNFIQKPFSQQALAIKVREILDGPG